MDSIKLFIEELLAEKDLPKLDEAVKEQLISDLSERLIQLINRRLIEAMPEESLVTLEKLMKEANSNKTDQQFIVQQFVNEQLPNNAAITANTMVEFRKLYLGANA